MTIDRIKNRRLAGIFLLGLILYNYPVFSLCNLPVMQLGIPLLYLYAFCAWALLIGLTMLVMRFGRPASDGHG